MSNHVATEDTQPSPSRSMSLYQNFVPISLLAVVIPVIIMGISAYYASDNNKEKIEIIRKDRQKFDIRLSEQLSVIDSKIDNVARTLERTSTKLENLELRFSELRQDLKER